MTEMTVSEALKELTAANFHSEERALRGRIGELETALSEIARRGALCIHQNIGRWNMGTEQDRRSYDVIDGNNEIALTALGAKS